MDGLHQGHSGDEVRHRLRLTAGERLAVAELATEEGRTVRVTLERLVREGLARWRRRRRMRALRTAASDRQLAASGQRLAVLRPEPGDDGAQEAEDA